MISTPITAALSVPFTSFELPIEVVILGLITGLIYGLLGIGLALLYRSARVINFAHGDTGALASGVMAVLVIRDGVPYGIALVIALLLAVMIGWLVEVVVIRRLADASRLVVLVATIGVSQVLIAGSLLVPRLSLASATFPTPFKATFTIGSLRLSSAELLIMICVPLIALGMVLFFQRSKIGLGARAAAENLEAARLTGIPARRISVAVWVLAALLSAAAAILVAPTRPLIEFQSLGPSLMLRALAAAVVGGMTSFPQVAAGGVAIGLLEALVTWNYPTGGLLELVLFAFILISMFVRKDLGRAGRGSESSSWSLGGAVHVLEPRLARLPNVRMAKAAAIGLAVGVAVVIPAQMTSGRLVLMTAVVLFALMGLSVTVLTGYSGQISLGQMAFVGLGAVVGGRMFQLGYPAWIGILYAALAGGVAAVLVGLPALRLRGLLLAVTSLGFAVVANTWVLQQDWLVTVQNGQTSQRIPRQVWFGIDFQSERNYYWLCLAMLILVATGVARMRRTGIGRSMMAVRDNEQAAATMSVAPRRIKLTAFVLSGMIAAFAGYFYGGLLVNFQEASLFEPTQSLTLVAMVIFGGVGTILGSILGAVWIQGIPYLFGSTWGVLSSGVGVLTVLLLVPGGLSSLVFRLRDRVVEMLTGEKVHILLDSERAAGVARAPLPPIARAEDDGVPPLHAEGVVVKFGGLTAVNDVSLEARRGEIIGLVGPNGAGKTTMFDVLSGQVRPTAGRVLLNGEDISELRPHQRALLGLGRSFQEARLYPDMPLRDAFRLALEVHETTELVPSILGLPASRAAERRKDLSVDILVDLLGLGPFADRMAGELSTGTRRFAELGVMLAMGADVLLLDEPTGGLAQREVEAFTPVLREIRDHLDATMVIIDHDITMIVGLVDRLYVMAAGELIANGPPQRVREDPAVVAAYLGTDERAIQRSGALAQGAGRTRPTSNGGALAQGPARRRRPLEAAPPTAVPHGSEVR